MQRCLAPGADDFQRLLQFGDPGEPLFDDILLDAKDHPGGFQEFPDQLQGRRLGPTNRRVEENPGLHEIFGYPQHGDHGNLGVLATLRALQHDAGVAVGRGCNGAAIFEKLGVLPGLGANDALVRVLCIIPGNKWLGRCHQLAYLDLCRWVAGRVGDLQGPEMDGE